MPGPVFADIPVAVSISPGQIDEASGIADSKANPGYLWIEQDSGNPNDIALLSYSGNILKTINIKPAVNRDWEDIALGAGPTPGLNYLYLADIGDNNQTHSSYTIYRFGEPLASIDTVSAVESIRFQYEDGSHDAEAILIDKSSKDIYIITKRDALSRIYKIPFPQNTTSINTATFIESLPFTGVVSAASSAAGDEIIVKTYTALFYWKRSANESIEQTLARSSSTLGYQLEPQGEAVCFKQNNAGFYTISERPSAVSSVALNFYQRK